MNNRPDPIELIAIARGLEDEGGYLAARLFRAAAIGEWIRRTTEHPRSAEDIAVAIDAVVPQLAVAGHDPALISAVQSVATMLRSGADRFAKDRTDLCVCRTCGQEIVGDAPERCPSCGAGALTFEFVLPIYFLESVPAVRLIPALAGFPDQVASICRDLTDERAEAGEWPARAILSHLVGAQDLLGARAVRTLEEDEPELRSVPPTEVVAAAGRGPGFVELSRQLRSKRAALLDRVRALSPDQWGRIGHHGEWGPITVQQQLSYIARHEQSHLGHLAAAAGVQT
ncbi:MAG: DinB family protein [Chloroflexota bacterium]|nr:DinB family protein [Chloroflexota bacterium]